jgi:hypothetical protein
MAGLKELLDYAFTMPTAVFSVLLGLVIVYWLLALLGNFSLEMLDAAEGALEGAADGLLDGADGAADAGGERGGFFDRLGFGDVPRTITWSLVIFFGWLFSLVSTIYLPRFTEVAVRGLTLVTVAVAVVSLGLAVLATTVAVQPLRKVVLAGYGTRRGDLVGRLCTVRTLRVDEDFGQAELDDGSSVIQVRNPQKYPFESGTKALIYDYDSAREVFYIMPAEEGG